jgi:large conductance mechanosensitive channel
MLDGFKKFLLRGNVVDMAVGVVVGVAFNGVVNALVKDLITPLIAAAGRKPDFSAVNFQLHGATFMLGDFFNALLSFLMIAAVVYYLVVMPVNRLVAHFTPAPVVSTKACSQCAKEIPLAAHRCPYCTSTLG